MTSDPHEMRIRMTGHVVITDMETGEIIVDQHNDLHPENMSEAVCLCLANRGTGNIHSLVFGNGASAINGIGAINYYPANIVGFDAQLYNQTFEKVVDDLSPQNVAPTRNKLAVSHVQNASYTDIVVSCVLEFNEPSGQEAFDTASNTSSAYIFDEMGIKAYDGTGSGKLLTHVIFHPVQKSLNRALGIRYTIRIMFV